MQKSGTLQQPCGKTILPKWHERSQNGRKSIEHNTDFLVFTIAQLQDQRILWTAAQMIVSSFNSTCWYEETYKKWIRWHRKCNATKGNYIEKINERLNFAWVCDIGTVVHGANRDVVMCPCLLILLKCLLLMLVWFKDIRLNFITM